jgi:hypothetical protein
LNAGLSATGLVGQLGAYAAGGGTAQQAAPFLAKLNGYGLALDFAVSAIGIGVAYNAWAANPNFDTQHAFQTACAKLMMQTFVAGVFFATGGIGAAALAFGIVGQLMDPESLKNFVAAIGAGFDRFIKNPLTQSLHDPIILDLDGDGIQLTSLATSSVHFDFGGDGFSERTGWAGANDGMLAIDANGNGLVDNGLELFGSATQDGFAILEKLDANGDGKIDGLDADFSKLFVWRDLNQKGSVGCWRNAITAVSGYRIDLSREGEADGNKRWAFPRVSGDFR